MTKRYFFRSFYIAFCVLVWSTVAIAAELPDLVFVQIPASQAPDASNNNLLFVPRAQYNDGSRIVMRHSSTGKITNLTPEFTAACDPDVSFDGESIIFAGKKNTGELWQIWRMNADGSNKVQITQAEADCFSPVHAGARFYLDDPKPTPQIIYVSSDGRSKESDPVYALYGTDHRGKTTHRLTFNLNSDFSPDVLPNGRIVFTSWQSYGERYAPTGIFALLAVNNDGTDLMPYYGNHEKPVYKDMVHVSDYNDRVYFIESERASLLGGGKIAYVSQRRPSKSYHRLSDDIKGEFHSPTSLPNGWLAASYRKKATNTFDIYSIDPKNGKPKKLIYKEANWHSIDTQVLAPHPQVKGRSNWLIPESTTGVFYCMDVYRSYLTEDKPIAKGAVKAVRVIEGLPTQQGPSNGKAPEQFSSYSPQRILGKAPVEKDGSFHIRVPAEIPVTFQLLDENNMALRTQKAWTWVIGNENRGCIGCHENPEMSPPNRLVDAIIKPAVELTHPPENRRTVDFKHQIAPLIQSNCAVSGCHVYGHSSLNFKSAEAAAVYTMLLAQDGNKSKAVIPGSAKNSLLIRHLFGKPMGAIETNRAPTIPEQNALNSEQLNLFIEWIDLGAQWDTRQIQAPAPSK